MLVDVGRVRELSYVRDAGDHVAIGALTRHRDVETDDVLARECGVVRAVAAQVGDNQVRHRGTIGGSVAHGDPASDLPAALLALDATFVVQGPGGTREIAASDFFRGFLETALAPDELLREIRVPEDGRQRLRVREVQPAGPGLRDRRRRRGARRRRDPRRADQHGLHAAARDRRWSRRWRRVRRPPTRPPTPPTAPSPTADLNASVEYREHLARVLVRRALEAL